MNVELRTIPEGISKDLREAQFRALVLDAVTGPYQVIPEDICVPPEYLAEREDGELMAPSRIVNNEQLVRFVNNDYQVSEEIEEFPVERVIFSASDVFK